MVTRSGRRPFGAFRLATLLFWTNFTTLQPMRGRNYGDTSYMESPQLGGRRIEATHRDGQSICARTAPPRALRLSHRTRRCWTTQCTAHALLASRDACCVICSSRQHLLRRSSTRESSGDSVTSHRLLRATSRHDGDASSRPVALH